MSAAECQDHLFCLLKTLPSDGYLSLLWITHSTLLRWLLNWLGQGWGFGAIIPFSGHQTTLRSQWSNLELKKVLRVLKRRNLGFQNRNVCRCFYLLGEAICWNMGKTGSEGPVLWSSLPRGPGEGLPVHLAVLCAYGWSQNGASELGKK